jgi:hypothetical protein
MVRSILAMILAVLMVATTVMASTPASDLLMDAAVSPSSSSSSSWMETQDTIKDSNDSIAWTDATVLGIYGHGFNRSDTSSPYDRLPLRAKDKVRPPVWSLSRDSAGSQHESLIHR